VCITFYTHKQIGLIQQIQAKVGAEFQKIGVPQPEDVIKASARDIGKRLEEVNDKVLALFEEEADNLIAGENGDAKKALCKTLALLSGHHKEVMTARSMLNG
jgi:ATP-dependent RNA helicase DDX21